MDDVWQDHCEHMLTIRSIFLYLDRSHVLQTPGLQPIWEMGLALFRQQLAQQGQGAGGAGAGPHTAGTDVGVGVGVEARVIRGLLDLIERQRNGESVNVSLLRSLVRMLAALGLYKPTFLRAFLDDTGRYFAAEGERRAEALDVVGFLRHVEGRLREAQEAVVQYLEPSTRRPLVQAIEARLLAPHVTALVERGFEPLMDANRCVRACGGSGVCGWGNAWVRAGLRVARRTSHPPPLRDEPLPALPPTNQPTTTIRTNHTQPTGWRTCS